VLLYVGGPVSTGKCLEPALSERKRARLDNGASESFVVVSKTVQLRQGNLPLMVLFDMGNPGGIFECYERATSERTGTEKSYSAPLSAVFGKTFLFLER
jgi:hypothetical protein